MNKPTGTIIAEILFQLAAMVAIVIGLALATRTLPPQPPIRKQRPTIEVPNRIDTYASYFYSRK